MLTLLQEFNLLAWIFVASACNTLLILVGFVALTRGLAQAGILDTRQNGAIWKLLRSVEIMTMNRIQVLVGRINGLIAAVASIIASLGIIRAKQTGLSNTLTKVQADVVFLRQQLADFLTNNPDLADAEAALASLESSVASLESDFAEVSQEVTNAEAAAAGIDSLTPEDADGDGVFSDTDQDDNDPNVGAFQS
jgi:hypothetical protein